MNSTTHVPPHRYAGPGRSEPRQMDLLMLENERLRQELEGHREKVCRIHKVRTILLLVHLEDGDMTLEWFVLLYA